MAWAMTIHKAQGLTLQKATINIGAIERQGLTFTVVSRVKSLEDLWIDQILLLVVCKNGKQSIHGTKEKRRSSTTKNL